MTIFSPFRLDRVRPQDALLVRRWVDQNHPDRESAREVLEDLPHHVEEEVVDRVADAPWPTEVVGDWMREEEDGMLVLGRGLRLGVRGVIDVRVLAIEWRFHKGDLYLSVLEDRGASGIGLTEHQVKGFADCYDYAGLPAEGVEAAAFYLTGLLCRLREENLT